VMIPSECHMTLYDTVDWVDDPLPLRTCWLLDTLTKLQK
jgi:hypothetical protein